MSIKIRTLMQVKFNIFSVKSYLFLFSKRKIIKMSQDHLNKIIFTCESKLIKICVFYVDKVVIISKKI